MKIGILFFWIIFISHMIAYKTYGYNYCRQCSSYKPGSKQMYSCCKVKIKTLHERRKKKQSY